PLGRSILAYQQFANGRPWSVTRRALFRWPQDPWETMIYGLFRRDVLSRHIEEHPDLRFRLQRLAFDGRFIAVPAALRGYRLHEGSLARRRLAKSEFQLLLRGLKLKWILLRTAAGSPAPPAERLRLIGIAVRNFSGNHVAWAHSLRRQIRRQ